MAYQLMGYAHHMRPSTRPQHRLLRWVPLTARCGRSCSGRCWCPTPAAFTARCHSWEWPRGGPCASTGLDQLGATGYSFLPLPPSEAVCSLQPATQGHTGHSGPQAGTHIVPQSIFQNPPQEQTTITLAKNTGIARDQL